MHSGGGTGAGGVRYEVGVDFIHLLELELFLHLEKFWPQLADRPYKSTKVEAFFYIIYHTSFCFMINMNYLGSTHDQ